MLINWDEVDSFEDESIAAVAVLTPEEKIENQSQELIARVTEVHESEVKDLIGLFNAHEAKRNMVRVNKLNKLFDSVTDQMLARFEKHPDNFSNDDLVKYMKTTQDALKQASDMVNRVKDEPAIQVTNNQLTVNVTQDEIPRESRERITDAVKAIMAQLQNPVVSDDVVVSDATIVDEETEN